MGSSRVDLRSGVVILTDGQRVPVTKYLGPESEAPDDDTPVIDFDWVRIVVAGPDSDGQWLTVLVTDEDRDDARTP